MIVKPLDQFLKDTSSRLDPYGKENSRDPGIKELNLVSNEILYVWDLRAGEMSLKRGFDLLGYADDSMNLKKFVGLFHPDDAEYLHRLVQGATQFLLDHPESCADFMLYVSFRIRMKEGRYVKVLSRSSCHDTFDNGLMSHAIVYLSDINFTDSSEAVSYRFSAKGLDPAAFHRSIYKDYLELFTPREIQVLKLIEMSKSNDEIANLLEISKYTVATHRKKIMKKSGTHNARELLLFCHKNGIL